MSIAYFEEEKIFMLQGKETTYAIGIDKKGKVCNLHWGGKLNEVGDLPTFADLAQRVTMLARKIPTSEFQEYRG